MVEQMPLMAVVDVNLKGEMAGGLIWRRKFGIEIDGSRKRAERFIVRIPLQMNPDSCRTCERPSRQQGREPEQDGERERRRPVHGGGPHIAGRTAMSLTLPVRPPILPTDLVAPVAMSTV